MGGIEDFIESFGFTKDAFTVLIISVVVLLANFAGGLFSNIISAFGGPIREKKMVQRTSFRLAIFSELFLVIYIVYYHMALNIALGTAAIIYWVFIFLAAPLLAAIGAQLIYVALADKIDKLKKEGRRIARGETPVEEAVEDDEEEEALTETAGG